MIYIIEILTFLLFMLLIYSMVRRRAIFESFVVISVIITVVSGELLNLFVFKATAYTGRIGVPVYIILGGALIGWTYYKLPCILAEKLKKRNIIKTQYFASLTFFFLLSLLFPVIEIGGIKSGLWYWLKPYSLTSIWWWIGVWEFYFIFLAIIPLMGITVDSIKKKRIVVGC